MKRILWVIVALTIILCIGTTVVGAEDTGTADANEIEVKLTLHFSLKYDIPTHAEISKKIETLPQLEAAYKSSTVQITTETFSDTYPIRFDGNKGIVECELFVAEKADINIKLISASFGVENEKNILVFEQVAKTLKLSAGKTSISADIEHEWSNELIRYYDALVQEERIKDAFEDLKDEGNTTAGSSNMVQRLLTNLENFANKLTAVGSLILADDMFASEQLNNIIENIYNIIYPIAFFLMCAIWLISLGKSGVTIELWQKESYIKPLLRLLWGIAMMAVCMPLLELIFSVFHGISAQAFGSISIGASSSFEELKDEAESWVNHSWIVGGIMTFINVILNIPNILVNSGFNLVFAIVFYVIVAIRFIKLAVLQCLSPFFFACSVSDKTEKYLQSFLREYVVLAAQILVAMAMYSILTAMFNSVMNAVDAIGTVFNLVMYLAAIISVAGSGKFLRNMMT